MTCRGEGPQQLMDFHVVIPWHSCVHLVALLLDVVFPSCLHPFPGVAVCGRVSMINGDIARPGRDLNRDWPAENGFTVDDCSDCFPACLFVSLLNLSQFMEFTSFCLSFDLS